MTRNLHRRHFLRRRVSASGFSLIELIVAMSVFLVVSVTSFTLFSRHETLLSQEQGVGGLNIGLRNALSQLQIDVVNAGNGQILGANVPAWPVGVTIINSNPTTATCNPTATTPPTYAAACFDQLNVVMVDSNTPPIHPTNVCTTPFDTSASGTLLSTIVPGVINPATGAAFTVAQVAANFKTNDQVIFVSVGTPIKYTTAVLTANGAAVTGDVQLTFNRTLSGGANSPGAGGNPPANDPISMTINAPTGQLTSTFCSTDWVLRMVPISYTVITTNTVNGIEDPQLLRTQGNPAVKSVVMDQVIGFKIGAAWWDSNTSTYAYCYSTGTYCDPPANTILGYNGDFTLVRSVRMTLIGRTMPSTDPLYTYRNPFDNGAYQIRGSSIVVDPRNLTMNND